MKPIKGNGQGGIGSAAEKIRTSTDKPVWGLVLSMRDLTNPTLSKITHGQALVTCGNSRYSIGLYFEQYGG